MYPNKQTEIQRLAAVNLQLFLTTLRLYRQSALLFFSFSFLRRLEYSNTSQKQRFSNKCMFC